MKNVQITTATLLGFILSLAWSTTVHSMQECKPFRTEKEKRRFFLKQARRAHSIAIPGSRRRNREVEERLAKQDLSFYKILQKEKEKKEDLFLEKYTSLIDKQKSSYAKKHTKKHAQKSKKLNKQPTVTYKTPKAPYCQDLRTRINKQLQKDMLKLEQKAKEKKKKKHSKKKVRKCEINYYLTVLNFSNLPFNQSNNTMTETLQITDKEKKKILADKELIQKKLHGFGVDPESILNKITKKEDLDDPKKINLDQLATLVLAIRPQPKKRKLNRKKRIKKNINKPIYTKNKYSNEETLFKIEL